MAANMDMETATCCLVLALLLVVALAHFFIAFHPGDDASRLQGLQLKADHRRRSRTPSDAGETKEERRHGGRSDASAVAPAFVEVSPSSDEAAAKSCTEPRRSELPAQTSIPGGETEKVVAEEEAAVTPSSSESSEPGKPVATKLPKRSLPSKGAVPMHFLIESGSASKRKFHSYQSTTCGSLPQFSEYFSEPKTFTEETRAEALESVLAFDAVTRNVFRTTPALTEATASMRRRLARSASPRAGGEYTKTVA